MELLSLHSPPQITRLPSSSSRRKAAVEKPTSFSGKALPFPSNSNSKRRPDARNPSFLHLWPRASGPTQVAAGSNTMTGEDNKRDMSSKDNDLVFVAGATGRVGSRTVRELLRLGFRVRAGVRSSQRAETLVQSVRQMKLDNVTGGLGTQPVEKLEIIECDLEDRGRIEPAIGNASVVICCIGASEKEVFDVTGPYRIDYKATENLVEAASNARVDHFILLTSLGTNKIGFPAAILNLFWGVLYWKRKAEEALIASGLPHTIVRPGGMERPTDSYKETHNIVLANEDTYFGGQVSNLQVAELMAFMAKHRRLSFCKIVEVIAETTAPLTPMEELLAKVPSQRELPAELKLEPVPLSTELGPTTSVLEKEVPRTMPLSPYTMYDDLKPPTSPTPTPSTTPGRLEEKIAEPVQAQLEPESMESIQAPALKASYHSPYMVYEDLKPPTSPTPTPSSTSKVLIDGFASASVPLVSNTGNDAAGTTPTIVNEKEIAQVPTQNSSHQPPYYLFTFEDTKPPSSPSPDTPSTTSSISTFAGDGNPTASTPEDSGTQQHIKKQTSTPLSPYTMYEDLKPPSSPVPSVPKY